MKALLVALHVWLTTERCVGCRDGRVRILDPWSWFGHRREFIYCRDCMPDLYKDKAV